MTKNNASFWFFLAAVLTIGIYFFKIVQPFVLPLLFAGTLAILAQPIFSWLVELFHGRRRLAAGVVTLATILLVALPIGAIFFFASQQLIRFGQDVVQDELADGKLTSDEWSVLPESVIDWLAPIIDEDDIRQLRDDFIGLVRSGLTEVSKKTAGLIADVVSFVIAVAIMILSFYYFLADGPAIADNIQQVLPFETDDEVAVVKQFERICRGVLIGTLASGLAQALLVTLAALALDIPGPWVLFCLTLVVAMVPFLGAGAIYFPMVIYLLSLDRYLAAAGLLIYGLLVVSTSDNLIRAYVIHGSSRLHPLVGLVSAIGAIKLIGLWGIFIGPVVAGIFYALLKILQEKLQAMDETTDSNPPEALNQMNPSP